eukprot:scaffold42063_cov63-Phaeocystis_antarctica.AAC.2
MPLLTMTLLVPLLTMTLLATGARLRSPPLTMTLPPLLTMTLLTTTTHYDSPYSRRATTAATTYYDST